MQYIRERAQQLNIKFISQRASMSGKIKSNSCKWSTRHFSTWVLEKLNILYKQLKNCKEIVELVVKLSTLVTQFLGGREKQNECLS